MSVAEVGRSGGGSGGSSVLLLNNDVLADVLVLGRLGGVVVRVVVAGAVNGVSDVVGYLGGCLGDTVTKRVVLAVVVVISHITLVLFGCVNRGTSSLYSNLLAMRVAAVNGVYLPTGRVGVVLGVEGLSVVARGLLVVGLGAEVAALSKVTSDDGTGTLAELTLGDVNLGGSVVGLRRSLDGVEVAVVGSLRCFEVATDDGTLGLVAVVRKRRSAWAGKRKERKSGAVRVARTTIHRIGLVRRRLRASASGGGGRPVAGAVAGKQEKKARTGSGSRGARGCQPLHAQCDGRGLAEGGAGAGAACSGAPRGCGFPRGAGAAGGGAVGGPRRLGRPRCRSRGAQKGAQQAD